ncbi:MAG: ribosome recycling factor [Prevotella sp.]|nr:ribosome recycling factor [Prevotella sp.]MBR0264805.1 ribosome recycling factor [Prevotella sp.]
MKKAIEILIRELDSKLGGYAALLNYRYLNLCVKAEPVALLPVVIEDKDGDTQHVEDVARTMLINQYQFEVIPMDQDMVFNICKGFLTHHPEFKQDVVISTEDHKLYRDIENEKHIILTVPEVNEDRRDFLLESVKMLYDQCKVQVDKTNAAYAAKLAAKVVGQPEDVVEESKNKLEESQQMYSDMIDKYLAAKQKEIEEAYQRYLNEQSIKKAKADETAAARGEHAGYRMRVGDTDE